MDGMGDLAAQDEYDQLARERAIRFRSNATNYSIQPGGPPMGETAAQDDYQPPMPDVGAPLIPSGPQVSAGVPWANRLIERLPGAVMGGVMQQVQTPGALMAPNPYPEGSELWHWYEDQKRKIATDWAPSMALNAMGTGAIGVPVKGAETVLGAGAVRDPRLWHGISDVKLSRPIAEMNPAYQAGKPIAEKIISPADLEGGWLMPGLGDRSMAGGKLTGVGGEKFDAPVWLQGGHGFMPANVDAGAAWASDLGVITRLANKTKNLAESGEVYFPYTAMGQKSVDFSHHMSDTLSEMLKQRGVSRAAAEAFDKKMINPTGVDFPAVENWPGINSPWLDVYLRNQPGVVRNKFAKIMDSREMQDLGLPEVAQARHAVTDPRLLDVTTGSGGLSIARLDPEGRIIARPDVPHQTYNTQLGGRYVGGFGTSVPKEILYPDIIDAYRGLGYSPAYFDYLMGRGVKGAPVAQHATPRWVDTVSKFIERGE